MAAVYLGHDLLLGRDVAIKSPRPQFSADPGFRARFEREARAAASLSHPNIIDVYDVGEDDGTPFIVMELVRGQSLKEIIAADAPFHPDDVAELLEQIGGALDYAHVRGYVHRDIKPGNILVDSTAGPDWSISASPRGWPTAISPKPVRSSAPSAISRPSRPRD